MGLRGVAAGVGGSSTVWGFGELEDEEEERPLKRFRLEEDARSRLGFLIFSFGDEGRGRVPTSPVETERVSPLGPRSNSPSSSSSNLSMRTPSEARTSSVDEEVASLRSW